MKLRVLRACLAAPAAALLGSAVPAFADNPVFPNATQVPVSLSAAGTTAYNLAVGSGGALSVQLQSGDLSVLLVDDHNNTTRDDMASGGAASIGLQPTSTSGTFQMDLSSQNGAQAVLQFTPGGPGGTSATSTGNGGVISISSQAGSNSVSVNGNGTVVSSSNGSVVIDGNGVSITDGAGSVSVGNGGVSIVSGNGSTVVSSGTNSAGNAATAGDWAGRRWWLDADGRSYRRDW